MLPIHEKHVAVVDVHAELRYSPQHRLRRSGGLLDWAGVLFCRVGGRWSRGRIMHERERMRDSVARDLSPAD
jgi:hypothetical protein